MKTIPPELNRWRIKEIAALCKVSLKTAQRWKDGTVCPPATALMILSRDLGCIDSAWSGWILANGQLVSPENWTASPGDVRAMQLKDAQVRAARQEMIQARQELEELRRTMPWLEDQPAPESWDLQQLLG
jgi:hypothetical protein